MDAETKTLAGLIVEPGVVIAKRYEVCERLGAGGVGMVYRAVDRELDREVVALKLLLPHLAQDETVFRRFRNEVLVARALSHPNIVRTHDMGRADVGYSYISMEYVNGVSLKDKLGVTVEGGVNRCTLAFDESLAILYQIISGVAYAHGKGVIHRDLKPANVLLSKSGEVKLADFGTARIMGMDTSLTQTGQVIGTPDYMSPEQIRGEQLDPSCDIYALGIVAYELAVGQRPFIADSAVAVAFKHLNDPLPAFASAEQGIPLWYEEVARKASAKKKSDRFSSVMEMAATLLDYAPQLSVQSTFFSVDRTVIRPSGTLISAVSVPEPLIVKPQPPPTGRGRRDSSEFKFELGSTPRMEEERWQLGGGDDGAKAAAAGLTGSGEKPSGILARIGGVAVGLIVAILVLGAATTRLSTQAGRLAEKQLADLAIRKPLTAGFFAAVLGVKILDSEKVAVVPRANQTPDPVDAKLRNDLENELNGAKSEAKVAPMIEAPVATTKTEEKITVAVAPPEVKKVDPPPEVSATPAPEPPKAPEPLHYAGDLMLREGTRILQEDSVSADRLPQTRWAVSLTVTGGDGSPLAAPALKEEFAINVFDLRKASIVQRLKPEHIELPTKSDASLRLSGSLGSLKGSNPSAGSYRLDLVRGGEVISSHDLVLYRASVSVAGPSATDDNRVTIVRGVGISGGNDQQVVRVEPTPVPALLNPPPVNTPPVIPTTSTRPGELPVAKGFSPPPVAVATPIVPAGLVAVDGMPPRPVLETVPAPTINENYGGSLSMPASNGGVEEKLAMILNLTINGTDVGGTANIAGFDIFTVSGRVLARGTELELKNGKEFIRLTSGPRGGVVRGIFSFPALQKKGRWEVSRSN